MIPFNKPYLTGKEIEYLKDAIASRKLSGDGEFTKKCQQFFEFRYRFHKTLLTTSCTDALDMAAILLDVGPGDEVIVPSFTFVSTANAFVLRGATIVFADSAKDNPNIDPDEIAGLITDKTRAIVVVHYAGVACDMGRIMAIAEAAGVPVVEDAAQAIDSYYQGRPLGGIGVLGTFSFHETKNITSGEGGLLAINDRKMVGRAEIIREKGTNRSSFFRGEVNKYGWVDIGSSFLPSEITAAFLYAQLESLETIQRRRIQIWNLYFSMLQPIAKNSGRIELPQLPSYATNNAHMFYLVCDSLETRSGLIEFLKSNGVMAVFHYLSLHNSPYYAARHDGRPLINSDRYTECLVRLPLFVELEDSEIANICRLIQTYLE